MDIDKSREKPKKICMNNVRNNIHIKNEIQM